MIKRLSRYYELLGNNKQGVQDYNRMLATRIPLIGICLFLMMFLLKVRDGDVMLLTAYGTNLAGLVLLFVIFRYTRFKAFPTLCMYLIEVLFFAFSTYLSVRSPELRSTIIIGIFTIGPLCIIDKPVRLTVFFLIMNVLHSIMLFIFKEPSQALFDMENCLCFSILGLAMSYSTIHMFLEGLENRRLLEIEKTTDVLTGLKNRRSLYETLESGQSKAKAVFMLDIDDFKLFNDKYGHSFGDQCLITLGKILLKFQTQNNIAFYRFGGEEFIGLWDETDSSHIKALAQNILRTVSEMSRQDMPITVSIGISMNQDTDINYDSLISDADRAMYEAKAAGKNCFSTMFTT